MDKKDISSFYTKIRNVRHRSFINDSFWMLFYKAFSAILQVTYFIILARHLGAEDYGLFGGVKSFFAIFYPFIGLGMGHLLVQNTVKDRKNFSIYWGYSLIVLLISIVISLLTIFPIAGTLLSAASPAFILLVMIAEFLGMKLCGFASNALISTNRVKHSGQSELLYTILKFTSVLVLPIFPTQNRLIVWGVLYCLSSVLSGIVLVYFVNRSIGKPVFRKALINFSSLKQGFYFSLSESAASINGQVDGTMLVTLDSSLAAGIYGGGLKFIALGLLPINAILSASYARFFKYGESGIAGSLSFAKKLLPTAFIYGVCSGIFLIVFSPFVPRILGEDFVDSQAVLIWLAPIHLLVGLQFLAADTLTAAGHQKSRSFVQVSTAILNVGLNAYMIPLYSWKGAIWATLISEVFSLLSLWTLVLFKYRQYSNKAKN